MSRRKEITRDIKYTALAIWDYSLATVVTVAFILCLFIEFIWTYEEQGRY